VQRNFKEGQPGSSANRASMSEVLYICHMMICVYIYIVMVMVMVMAIVLVVIVMVMIMVIYIILYNIYIYNGLEWYTPGPCSDGFVNSGGPRADWQIVTFRCNQNLC